MQTYEFTAFRDERFAAYGDVQAESHAHLRNMRLWSSPAMNVPIHLVLQRRGPVQAQAGRR